MITIRVFFTLSPLDRHLFTTLSRAISTQLAPVISPDSLYLTQLHHRRRRELHSRHHQYWTRLLASITSTTHIMSPSTNQLAIWLYAHFTSPPLPPPPPHLLPPPPPLPAYRWVHRYTHIVYRLPVSTRLGLFKRIQLGCRHASLNTAFFNHPSFSLSLLYPAPIVPSNFTRRIVYAV